MTGSLCDETERVCTECGNLKSIDRFYKNSNSKRGRLVRCSDCVRNKMCPEYKRNYQLMYKFGLSAKEYDEKLKKQSGTCAICFGTNKNKRLAVDHCHSTGKVRDLLCDDCNIGLGKFKDTPEFLMNAAKYLEKHS